MKLSSVICVIIVIITGGQLEKNEYQSKFFLTGFLLASAIIIYLTMIFLTVLIAMQITSWIGTVIAILGIGATAIGYFYVLHRFEREQTYSKMAIWYVLTIALLGLVISSICYLGIVGISNLSSLQPSIITVVSMIIIGYFVITEIVAILALLSSSIELRELKYRNFYLVYAITVATLLLLSYVFKTVAYATMLTAGLTVISIFLCTYYILTNLKRNLDKYNIDNIENRYRFVIKVLIDCVLIPVQMPIDLKNRILSIKK